MRASFTLILLICCVVATVSAARIEASVSIDAQGTLTYKNTLDQTATAYGYFDDTQNSTGWGFLFINSNAAYPASLQARALGYLESLLTIDRAVEFYYNSLYSTFPDQPFMPSAVATFFDTQRTWTMQQASALCQPKDTNVTIRFWCNILYSMQEVDGMLEGFNAHRPLKRMPEPITWAEFQVMNAGGDIADIISALSIHVQLQEKRLITPAGTYRNAKNELIRYDRCSALINLFTQSSNGSTIANDIVFSHATWFTYSTLTRIYKVITDNFESTPHTISYSSYPGSLSSTDDWYVNDAGLMVTETSNSVLNHAVYKNLKPQSLACWVRSVAALRLATDAPTWSQVFQIQHAGSYPNQWMIVDTKKFVPGVPVSELQNDLFWVVEELPGYYVAQDQTQVLRDRHFWPSFNVPFYPIIFDVSGSAQAAKHDPEYGMNCSRSRIFNRDAPNVVASNSMDSVRKLMRYNDYKHDPISNGDPSKTIASRYDLAEPFPNAYGALDLKTSSYSLLKSSPLTVQAISGPTYDQQPVFSWVPEFDLDPHEGQPITFDFPYYVIDSTSWKPLN